MTVTKLPAETRGDRRFGDIPSGTVFQKYHTYDPLRHSFGEQRTLNKSTYYMKIRHSMKDRIEYSNTVTINQATKTCTSDSEIVRTYEKVELFVREIGD